MNTLPSIKNLKRLDNESRRRTLTSLADGLYREAAHAIAPRFSYGSQYVTDRAADEIARARRSSRDRLRRLYDRADHFGIDVGQPRVLASDVPAHHRYAVNGMSTNTKFDFAEVFQSQIAALVLRDATFAHRCRDFIYASYFSNAAEAAIVRMALKYYRAHNDVPDKMIVGQLLKKEMDLKVIRPEMIDSIKLAYGKLLRIEVFDRDFVVDRVEDFSRRRFVAPSRPR